MKVFAAVLVTLALAAVSSAGEDKYEMMLKNWGKMKAFEGCFGETLMKDWIMTMKKAKAKCSGKPAPELNLPMFQKSERLVTTLLKAGMDAKQRMFVDSLMRKAFIQKLMRQKMVDLMEGDEDDIFGDHKSRFARAVDDEDDMEYDEEAIKEKMIMKMKKMELMFESDIGNMTCVLQEIGAITAENEIDVTALDAMVDEADWSKGEDGTDRTYLQGRMKEIHHMCKDLSDNVPESILNDCSMPHYITRLIYFKKCKKFYKAEACMFNDVRNKISKHGMTVESLAKEADIKVDDLVPLMSMVLFGKKM